MCNRTIAAKLSIASLGLAVDIKDKPIQIDDADLVVLANILNQQVGQRFSKVAREDDFVRTIVFAMDKVADGLQTAFEAANDLDEEERRAFAREVAR